MLTLSELRVNATLVVVKATAGEHRVLERVSAALLFLLPFVVFPIGQSPFEIPKVIIFELAIVGGMVILSGQWTILSGKLVKTPSTIKALYIGIFLLGIFQMAFYSPSQILFGNVFRLQGAFLLWCLILWSIISTDGDRVISRGKIALGALGGLFISSLLVGLSQDGRAVGTLGEPNTLAATALTIWPFVWFAKHYEKQPFVKLMAIAIPVILLGLTGSRSAVIGLGSQLVFVGLLHQKISLVKSLVIGIIIVILSYLGPFLMPRGELESRPLIWQTAVTAGLAHPIIGNGFGRTQESLYKASWDLTNALRFQVVDSSHNIFLDWWVQGGLVGLGLFTYLFITSTKGLVEKQMTRNLTILLGLLAMLSFNPASIVTLVAFWWILGRGLV